MTLAEKIDAQPETPSTLTVLGTIARFSAQAVWLDFDLELKAHLLRMCDVIAAQYGKTRFDVSLTDLHHLATRIHKVARLAGISDIHLSDVLDALRKMNSVKENVDSVAFLYRFARLVLEGKTSPVASKYLLAIALTRLKRASITYAAGILAVELYKPRSIPESESTTEILAEPPDDPQSEHFDSIFVHFDRQHLASLCALLKIGADINATDNELRHAIFNEFSYYTKNLFTHVYHKVSKERSQYMKVLLNVCTDLDIAVTEDSEVIDIEQKIVSRVLQETVDKLSKTQREELLLRLSSLSGVEIDLSKIATGGSVAALIIGNYAGFGTYLAASSALGVLTSGLGMTASFGVYTSLTTAISIALGPIGFGAATAAFIATLTKSSPRKAVPAIVYIATMRAKLNTEIIYSAKRERKFTLLRIATFGTVCIVIGYMLSHLIH